MRHRHVDVRDPAFRDLTGSGVQQGGSTLKGSFTLKSAGTDMLFFTKWKLEPVVLPTVKVTLDAPSSATALVNGKTVSVGSDGSVTLEVFPGTYAVSMKSTELYEAKSDTVKVTYSG